MVHRALSDKTYLPLGLLSPLKGNNLHPEGTCYFIYKKEDFFGKAFVA